MAGLGPIPQLVEWMSTMTKDYMSPQQVCALLTFVEFCKRQEVPIFANFSNFVLCLCPGGYQQVAKFSD